MNLFAILIFMKSLKECPRHPYFSVLTLEVPFFAYRAINYEKLNTIVNIVQTDFKSINFKKQALVFPTNLE